MILMCSLFFISVRQSRKLPLLQMVSNNKSFPLGVQSTTKINTPRDLSARLEFICYHRQAPDYLHSYIKNTGAACPLSSGTPKPPTILHKFIQVQFQLFLLFRMLSQASRQLHPQALSLIYGLHLHLAL